MSNRPNPVEEYLVKNIEHLNFIIYQVSELLPNAYFYKAEVRKSYFEAFRNELDYLSQKCQSFAYRHDKNVQQKYKNEVKRYEKELKTIGEENRQEFIKWLLNEEEDVQAVALYNLITYYKLLKYLRTFNNDIRR